MRTPEQVLGPYFPVGSQPRQGADLVSRDGVNGSPKGELVEVIGRVIDCNGKPIRGAKIVIWQANSFGRYAHPNDDNIAPHLRVARPDAIGKAASPRWTPRPAIASGKSRGS